MILIEILSIVIATVLLFLPVIGLLWSFFPTSAEHMESGSILTSSIIVVFVCLLALLLRYFACKKLARAHLGTFVVAALALATFTCTIGIWLAFVLNVTDSSHGGTLILQVSGCLGIASAATAWLSHRTRNALTSTYSEHPQPW
jgi:hypothetical protein